MKGLSLAMILWLAVVHSAPQSGIVSDRYDSDSLEPVIAAIERRQREMDPFYLFEREPDEEIIFVPEDYGQPEDIGYGYQKAAALSSELATFKEHYPYLSNQELEKLMLDYLGRGRLDDNYVYGKAIKKSVFRERDESEYPDKLQKLSPEKEGFSEDAMYKNQSPFRERFRESESRANERHANNADMEYLNALNTLWEQYQHKQDYSEDNEDSNDINDNIQLSDEDIAAILSYFEDKNDDDPRLLEELDQMNENIPYVYLKNKHHLKNSQKRMWRDGPYESHPGYGNSDRILLKKRALKTIPDLRKKKPPPDTRQRDHSRDTNADKELTQIFDGKKNATTKPPSEASTTTPASTVAQTLATVTTQKPIVVRKKSVDWSNYFGVDKRKKKSYKRNSADSWPMDYMYHNEINNIEAKDFDTKFRDMEDMILDQVIKYTGAHEGVRNPEQLHRIKQKIMAQLATAYNLEKMRHTLNEYKPTIDHHNMDRNRYPDKRVTIKKELVEPKDTGVTLEEESNSIPEMSKFPAHTKKSFFRHNSNTPYARGYSA